MSRAILFSAFSAAVLAVSGCAPTAGEGGTTETASSRQCFFADEVRNFRGGETQSIYVRDLRNQVFELRGAGFCRDLDYALALSIRPQTGGINRLCTGDWAEVAVAGGGATPSMGPCRVQVTRALTEAEVEALPSRQRP